MSALAGIFAVVLAGYAAAILIVTSQRVQLTRSALAIAVGSGTLTGVALYARLSFHLWSRPRGRLEVQHMALGWWALLVLGLPLLTGFVVARRASPDTANATIAARRGALAAMCATGTGLLVLAALTAVTIAISPQSVPLHTPPPPPGGGCETCGAADITIPSALTPT